MGSREKTGSPLVMIFGIVVVLASLYFLKNVAIIVFASLILAALVEPTAKYFARFRVPMALTVVGSYLVGIGLLVLLSALILPSLARQITELADQYNGPITAFLTQYPIVENVTSGAIFKEDISEIAEILSSQGVTSGNIFDLANYLGGLVSSAFGGALTIIIVMVLALYLVLERSSIRKGIDAINFPIEWKQFLFKLVPKVQVQVSAWLRGQILIMIIIFALDFIVLTILDVPFALLLALIGGFLEIIPFLGPNVAGLVATLVASTVSLPLAGATAVGFFIIQQLENHVITPNVFKRVGGISPVFTIIAVAVGFEVGILLYHSIFAGAIGSLLAIPLTMILGVVIKEWYELKG